MDELVEARDAAEAANVLKSHFLANMSHEIRTPLNGVLAMAQIMAMGEMAPKQRERLGVIRQSGEALLTVLNDILDLSKIEAGRMELEDADFDTKELAGNLEAAHQAAAAAKGLSFSVDITPAAAGVRRGDAARLQQILNNLLANAVKFTHQGEVRVLIDGEGEGGEGGLKISVSDTGIGVPSDKLPLLFQKFSQVDSSTTRQFGGTGLGLAICRELAQLMGGNVWADSIQGVGSTFFVNVPMKRVSAAAPARAPANASSAAEISSLRILAAEDNATNQLVLKTVISTFGLDVDIVPDGQKAVEAWASGDYDLILMDIQMPVMDGITATREIRATEARTGRPRTPIVALSANAMVHQVKEYLNAGMDMHVAKPIQLAKLHEALAKVLNDAEAAEPVAAPAKDAVA
jgi:CheY-like chemotaxis protein